VVTVGFAQIEACQSQSQLLYQHHWQEAAATFQDCELGSPGNTDARLYCAKSLITGGWASLISRRNNST
jgi:hypothetical protein